MPFHFWGSGYRENLPALQNSNTNADEYQKQNGYREIEENIIHFLPQGWNLGRKGVE